MNESIIWIGEENYKWNVNVLRENIIYQISQGLYHFIELWILFEFIWTLKFEFEHLLEFENSRTFKIQWNEIVQQILKVRFEIEISIFMKKKNVQ